MIWQTNKPKYLASILIESDALITGTVTADLICIDNQTVIASGLSLSLIAGTTACYQLLIDEDTYTIDRQEYKAIYYYDGTPKIEESIQLESFNANKISNNSMIGIIEDTQTLAGDVEL